MGHANQGSHVTTRDYLKVFVLLFVVTAIEYAIVKTGLSKALILTMLFVLSALKFFYVAAVFMHLKFDGKYLSWFFGVGFGLAIAFVTAVYYIRVA